MSEVLAWTRHDDDTNWIWDDQIIVFEYVDATPEQVRWVCAVPEIMAALKELSEVRSDADEVAALNKLTALYERLK